MASPIFGSPTSSPPLDRAGLPTFAVVSAAANSVFSEAVSESSAPPLQGRTTPSDVINLQLEQADQEYEKGNLEGAYSFYQAAQANFNSFKELPDANFFDPSNIPAACCIGIAKTCDPSEKANNVKLAEQALLKVYQNKANWDKLDREDKTLAYFGLRNNIQDFKPLIPESKHAEFYPIIEDCKKHIPSIDIATYELKKGQKLFNREDITGARAAYEEALTHAHQVPAKDKSTAEFRVLTASIHIRYAKTYLPEDNGRILHCQSAFAQILLMQKYANADNYQTVLSLCNQVKKLVPITQQDLLQSIQSVVEKCQKGIGPQHNPSSSNQGPSKSGRGPRRPQRSLRLLVTLAFAGLMVFAGVWLYRRLITKIE